MSEEKQYAERDLMAMDSAGNHYCRHVSAMTREQLQSKSDIAAELGWRDMQIAELKAQRDMYLNAEVSWEKSMMAAIGEDGVGSVAKAIAELKAQRDALAGIIAGHLEKLAGSMLNRTLDSGSKQAVAYADCADMVAKFAAQLRAGEPS